MIKYIAILALSVVSLLALKIETVDDSLKNFYFKNGVKIIKANGVKIIKAQEKPMIYALIEDKQESEPSLKEKFSTLEDVNKTREAINVSSEAADFFESMNKEENKKPLNLE